MTKKSTIKYISDLMSNPARLSASDQGSIGGLRQSFPYFVPVRYLDAVALHRESPYSTAMLSAISPYMGNWILFSDFMDASLHQVAEAKTDGSSLQEPDTFTNTSISVAQDSLAFIDTEPEEISSALLATIENEETAVANSIVATQDTVLEEATNVTDELSSLDIVSEDIWSPATPAIVDEISNEVVTVEESAPEVITNIAEKEIMPPIIVIDEPVVASEHSAITNITPNEIPAIYHNAATEEVLQISETVEDTVIKAELAATESTTPEINTVTELSDSSNTLEMMAKTNAIDSAIAETSSSDIEEEHKNFWTQVDDAESTTSTHHNTLSSVAAPIPEQLPIKKTPAPDSTIQSQIPDEEFRPMQHTRQEKPLIYPIYTEDYFLQQGEKISPVLPTDIESLKAAENLEEAAKSLMVMMSFSEWLLHFKSSSEKQKEETKDQRALKTMWQKEKLAAAIEEENEEIPENVFEMAVNSITKEDGLASESLADIYIKQGKLDKAIDMYRKLSLRNPQKNAYFARKIEEILKEK